MIDLRSYIEGVLLTEFSGKAPWEITAQAQAIIEAKIKELSRDEYTITGTVAIHKSAVIEQHVVLKGAIIVNAGCFIGAHAYLRGGVYLDHHISIGPGCEVKSSFLFAHTALAHFNFVGDSIIGKDVNMEAGSVICNHFNERKDKQIAVLSNGDIVITGVTKFGAVVGDHARIGANAVLSPGTLLGKSSIVKRLQLIEQLPPIR